MKVTLYLSCNYPQVIKFQSGLLCGQSFHSNRLFEDKYTQQLENSSTLMQSRSTNILPFRMTMYVNIIRKLVLNYLVQVHHLTPGLVLPSPKFQFFLLVRFRVTCNFVHRMTHSHPHPSKNVIENYRFKGTPHVSYHNPRRVNFSPFKFLYDQPFLSYRQFLRQVHQMVIK